uniref:Uncharacterized protein n=1 Tax=Heterorhabditis bacteriophora TaxID=37862 RepID=A0A1I7WF24_HETBA
MRMKMLCEIWTVKVKMCFSFKLRVNLIKVEKSEFFTETEVPQKLLYNADGKEIYNEEQSYVLLVQRKTAVTQSMKLRSTRQHRLGLGFRQTDISSSLTILLIDVELIFRSEAIFLIDLLLSRRIFFLTILRIC